MGSASRIHRPKKGKGSFRRKKKHPWQTAYCVLYYSMSNEEMNKAFDDFHDALDEALNAIEDFHKMNINKTVSQSWERQVDMNGDVYIREDEDYLDRD